MVRRGRSGCAIYIAALAVASLVGCASKDSKPDPAYEKGYKAGESAEVLRLIKQQGELPLKACDDTLTADKTTKGYSYDDEAVYKQGCLDSVRAQGISPSAGF
jgi:type IV pilus biogenesis protein CpaD/CtpE